MHNDGRILSDITTAKLCSHTQAVNVNSDILNKVSATSAKSYERREKKEERDGGKEGGGSTLYFLSL